MRALKERGVGKNLRFSANIGIHALDMALRVIRRRVKMKHHCESFDDFVRTRPSHMHRCCAIPFAFLYEGRSINKLQNKVILLIFQI